MPETTARLLTRARDGDTMARDELHGRYAAILRRLATGRIPSGTMDVIKVDELVHGVLKRAFERLDEFEPPREGALLASLRHDLFARIQDEITRRPAVDARAPDGAPVDPGPIEQAVGGKLLKTYESSLQRLTQEQQEGIILRLEMGFAYPEIADALRASGQEEARQIVVGAILSLSELLDDG